MSRSTISKALSELKVGDVIVDAQGARHTVTEPIEAHYAIEDEEHGFRVFTDTYPRGGIMDGRFIPDDSSVTFRVETIGQFTLDGSLHRYDAVSYGDQWNGWLTPVVTRATYERLIAEEDPEGKWLTLTFDADGTSTMATLDTDQDNEDVVIAPDAAGHYDLADLGWTFSDVDE